MQKLLSESFIWSCINMIAGACIGAVVTYFFTQFIIDNQSAYHPFGVPFFLTLFILSIFIIFTTTHIRLQTKKVHSIVSRRMKVSADWIQNAEKTDVDEGYVTSLGVIKGAKSTIQII